MGKESMPNMPIIKPKRVFTVENPEELAAQAGFGKDAKEIEMMNQMMVEGSGMEGMDMSGHGHGHSDGSH
jgi:hypothetical protein